MFYKVIVECFNGTGSFEVTRFVEDGSPIGVVDAVRAMPRVKKKDTLTSIKLLKEVTKEEYLKGIRGLKKLCSKASGWNGKGGLKK